MSGGNASTGNTALRYLVLENQHELVSRSTIQHIQMLPDFLHQNQTQHSDKASTASLMVNWMRTNANDQNVNLRYCFLSSHSVRNPNFHRHPKGRPSQKGRPRLSQVEQQMEYNDQLVNTFRGNDRDTEESQELLAVQENTLGQAVTMARSIQEDYHIDTVSNRILLGAGWVDKEAHSQFLRFPEVLFIDSTHKTNNEARPLLMICGRDQCGKAFVVARVFMPNETSAFYRWVFLKCLPCILGSDNLKRIRLAITDGDAQEFEAVEESCLQYLTNAVRGRCMYHIVQKTFERAISNHVCRNGTGNVVLKQIKSWIYTWGDGSSCVSDEQFQLSKSLLLQHLQSGSLNSSITDSGLASIEQWLQEKILPHEKHFVFWKKRFLRCFDEYVNNSGEAMNQSCKRSDLSTKPSMSMHVSAKTTLNQSRMSSRDRQSNQIRQLVEVPLFIKEDSTHDLDTMKKLTNMARHMLIRQYSERSHYTVLRHNETTWYVLRNSVVPSSEFRGNDSICQLVPPHFKTAWCISLDHRGVLSCNCGYKHWNGIPCRHLFAIEEEYNLSDIAVRWQTAYAYYAFHPNCQDVTDSFCTAAKVEHNGIYLKTDISTADLTYPYIWSGSQYSIQDIYVVINSPVPLCWNCSPDEYPEPFRRMAKHSTSSQTSMEMDLDDGNHEECHEIGHQNKDGVAMYTQESVSEASENETNGHLTNNESHKFAVPFNQEITHSQIITALKDMLPLLNTANSRNELFSVLIEARQSRCQRLLDKSPNQSTANGRLSTWIGSNESSNDSDQSDRFVSSNMPFDKSRQSHQHTYKRNRHHPNQI